MGENLGAEQEGVSRFTKLAQLSGRQFAPLNYLILRSTRAPDAVAQMERKRSLSPGIPDEAFARPKDRPETMTRQEVRAVLLSKLGALAPGDTVWDIGAGFGTVSVEIAILRRAVEVLAVERNPERAAFVRQNREEFGAYNIRVVEGSAPAALAAKTESPQIVFIGGSGEELPAMLDFIFPKLQDGGRLLANFVTLEHLLMLLQRLREERWPFEVTQVQVARSDRLAGLTGLRPQRAVFLVSADKPEQR
jgi:precorrin-6Y C5,15-methyltransferase (decarboxylating)